VSWIGMLLVGVLILGDLIIVLCDMVVVLWTPLFEGLLLFIGGFVGVFIYDVVCCWEWLFDDCVDDFYLFELIMMFVIDFVVFDYFDGLLLLVVNVVNMDVIDEWVDEVWVDVVEWLDRMIELLSWFVLSMVGVFGDDESKVCS